MTYRTKRRGFALMLVILEMVLIAALLEVAHRQLAATMRFVTMQQALQPLTQGAEVCKPLAHALSLLETGEPWDHGTGIYSGNLTILVNSQPAYFIVTYQKQPPSSGSTDETWTVTATQQTVDSSELAAWNNNLLPSSFAP